MKKFYSNSLAQLVILIVFFSSCTKNVGTENITAPQNLTNGILHNYGLLPMTADQWSSVPTFSSSVFASKYKSFGLSAPSTLPSSYLLSTPAVRDQGQIGSCTGFCGAETDEILNYYSSKNTYTSQKIVTTPVTTANILPSATNTQFVNSALFGSSSALSPLFLYYVERVAIQKQSISTDAGAFMVNIGQALQGLSNNTGTGAALKATISKVSYNFAGIASENLYPYPTSGSNRSTQYRTAPTSAAISNALNYTIAAQNGTTGSSGTTATGYYLINSTDVVADAKIAIANNKPVMMGFNVYDNASYQYFEGLGIAGYAPTNYTYNPLTSSGSLASGVSLLGGHAVPLVGYVDDSSQPGGGVFIVENSWSTSWGYKGYFLLPYSVLRSTKVVPAGNLYVAIM